MILTTASGADRTGQTYGGPLILDQQIKIDWTQLATAGAPVLQAAIQWLQMEESHLKGG